MTPTVWGVRVVTGVLYAGFQLGGPNSRHRASNANFGTMPGETFEILPVSDESAWHLAREIREEVFIREQACPPEEEWDEFDEVSRHFVGYLGDQAVGVARWRTTYVQGRAVAKLERFAVLRPYRGRGYGKMLIEALLKDAHQAGFPVCYVHAQAHLEPLYASFGFRRVSSLFEEVGIPHVAMITGDNQPAG